MESASTALLGANDSYEGFADETAGSVVGVSQGGDRAMRFVAYAFLFAFDGRHDLASDGGATGMRAVGLHGDAQGSRG